MKTIKFTFFILLTTTFFISCSSDDNKASEPVITPEATSVTLANGNNQATIIGTELPNQIEVLVKDQSGSPFTGATVQFTTTQGTVNVANATSNTSGLATTNWTLGSALGEQTLTATVFKADGTTPLGGSPLNISATGEDIPCITALNPTSIAIPDDDQNGISSVINIGDTFTISDVNVIINITQTHDDDLDVFLIAPDGTEVELTTDNGAIGDNFTDTIFDDDATKIIADYDTDSLQAPFTGSYQPEGSLATLNGKSSAGNWTLKVLDDLNQDTGTLESWSIVLCGN